MGFASIPAHSQSATPASTPAAFPTNTSALHTHCAHLKGRPKPASATYGSCWTRATVCGPCRSATRCARGSGSDCSRRNMTPSRVPGMGRRIGAPM